MRKRKFIVALIIMHVIGIVFIKRIFFHKAISSPSAEGPRSAEKKQEVLPPLDKSLQMPLSGRRAMEKTAVKVEVVKKEDLDFILSYVGSLKAKDEAYIFSKVGGKFSGYLAVEGDKVEKDQVIALVERDETGLKYEPAKVSSPLNGIIGRTFLDKGANVIAEGPQATAIAIAVNTDKMSVRLNISEADIPYMQKGQKAFLKFDAYPKEEFQGEVSKVSEVVDTATRTLPVEITIPNPDNRLKSGMFTRIDIFAAKHAAALVIIQDALVKEDSSAYVYAVENSRARKIKVLPGIYQDGKVEIVEGLTENQKVIVFGHQGLKDGAEINIVE